MNLRLNVKKNLINKVSVWRVNNMRKQDMSVALLVTSVLFLAFSAIWMGLEMLFYGEVQHRIIDDIISVFIIISFYRNVVHTLTYK